MQQIQGWYYLHENKELIYKPNPDAITGIRESDLCHSAWTWDGTRQSAWAILVESLSLGAKKERIDELAKTWGCDDKDAISYAQWLGIELGEDGSSKFARCQDFINLQESPCGFGDIYLEAMSDLAKQLGYVGGTMWNATFKDLITRQVV